jgi:hypothetical protein
MRTSGLKLDSPGPNITEHFKQVFTGSAFRDFMIPDSVGYLIVPALEER